MKLPYIRIHQQNEDFYLTKLNANILLDKVDFHFRQAYSEDPVEVIRIQRYLDKLNRQGIDISTDSEGIQRRLQISRIRKIADYLNSPNSFFPNCVILSVNIDDDDSEIIFRKENNVDYLVLDDDISFQIIDGQHRLAGLFNANENVKNNFDVPIVLFINVTKNFCAKIFVDVNGNQTPVNKSVIYDLCELTPDSEDFETDKKLHFICKRMNEEKASAMYRHIKMLGIGNGAISQAFMVDALRKCFINSGIDFNDLQLMYTHISLYLKSYQRSFPEQWPVLEECKDDKIFWNHSNEVLKKQKSQMLKTNGLGGILRAFPTIYKTITKNAVFKDYYNLISTLKGKINWSSDDVFTQGTGAKNQEKVKGKILNLLNLI